MLFKSIADGKDCQCIMSELSRLRFLPQSTWPQNMFAYLHSINTTSFQLSHRHRTHCPLVNTNLNAKPNYTGKYVQIWFTRTASVDRLPPKAWFLFLTVELHNFHLLLLYKSDWWKYLMYNGRHFLGLQSSLAIRWFPC